MLNKVWDIKKTFFDYENKVFQSLKNGIFLKGLTHASGQKIQFFSLFFWWKKGLEIRFNDVLDEKETFFVHKNKIFQRLKNHAFGQKMPNFSVFRFGQNKTRNNAQ